MTSVKRQPAPVSQQAEDEYWGGSSFKRFNFDEDDNNEDSIEKIQFDGSTATPLSQKYESTRNHATSYGHGERSYVADTPLSSTPPNRAMSARSHRPNMPKKQQFPPSPATLPAANHEPVKSNNSQHSMSITEAVAVHDKKPITSATSLAQLETEINSLRRQLTQAKRDRAAAPSVSDTLKRVMVGDPYVLELYKSKDEKAKLLDSAINRHDGNAVVAATLFMRDTLKRDIFSKELMSRPVAVDHYCAYLREAGEIDELHETLSALGRTEEAAMLKYKQCLASTATTTPEIRASGLKDCIKYYFDADIRLANDTSAIFEQISMMERQSAVEDGDSAAEKTGQVMVFKSHPRKESIIHKPVIDTLFYCCYYHWGEAEGLLSSPTSIRNQHKISEKQFMFTAVAALCRMRRWRDIENLLTVPRTLFRSSRLQAVIGFDRVVDVLSKNLAPGDALAKYCAEIETSDKRLEMAVKLKCFKVAIDTFVYQRDRQQLMLYLDQIPQANQHMRQYCSNQLRSQEIKWKN
uniref:Spermatogenesis-defective protein 39 homolog n=1 Tax=Phallusia mammillata TaxID=59560 RepID=A0A6F9DX63_9ASCI|nr:spermatogenesis-defective protein 39 homolog [Phallusia mammillata]